MLLLVLPHADQILRFWSRDHTQLSLHAARIWIFDIISKLCLVCVSSVDDFICCMIFEALTSQYVQNGKAVISFEINSGKVEIIEKVMILSFGKLLLKVAIINCCVVFQILAAWFSTVAIKRKYSAVAGWNLRDLFSWKFFCYIVSRQ